MPEAHVKPEYGKVEGDIRITDSFELYGMATGSIHVLDGGVFLLHGVCCKDLFVYNGSTVSVYGMVSGDVVNRGGNLEIFGTISGNLSTLSGHTNVSSTAVVSGNRA